MPSPRSSPAMRPSSPLSTSYKASAHFDSLPPAARQIHASKTNSQRRANTNSLKLPSLPRFHPANYPSAYSSAQNTPDGISSPQPPVSPRAHQRMYSDAQKQLFLHQREMVSAATRALSPHRRGKPTSPRLAPLGSPGPVTPLALEDGENYLAAGVRGSSKEPPLSEELVEQLIRKEALRQRREPSPAAGFGKR